FILGAAKFDGPYESTSFTTAKYLAQKNDVYYFDYPYTWKDYKKKGDLRQFEVRKRGFGNPKYSIIDTEIPRLKVVVLPLMLSINFLPEGSLYRFLLNINDKRIIQRIKYIIASKKIKDYIYINSFNFHYPSIASRLNALLNVYHCVDPIVVDHDKRHGIKSEMIIIDDADIIICTSRKLYIEKSKLKQSTYFIPNAANLSHSGRVMDPNLQPNPIIQQVQRPIIGYFGNIERRIDYDLLGKVADLNPDKTFVLAGPVSKEYITQSFKEKKNIVFHEAIPYNEMPAMIKAFDVCIIPFKKDEFSSTIFPLKLFEYLGSGKPVVATNFNEDLSEFTLDAINYCSDAISFSNEINRILRFDSSLDQKKDLPSRQIIHGKGV
ncbi:MAG: glycosyltransferase, partial [Chryseobacterium sp.]